jgi:hypothetical protein
MVKHLHTLCSGFPPGAADSYRLHDLRTLRPGGWTRPSAVRFPVLLHAVTYPFPTYPFPVDGAPPGREAPITSSGDMPDNRPSVPRRLAADGGGPQ